MREAMGASMMLSGSAGASLAQISVRGLDRCWSETRRYCIGRGYTEANNMMIDTGETV